MSIRSVGVIGAGVMGTGVAQVAAQAGFGVVLVDISDAILSSAKDAIRQGVRMQLLLAKGPERARAREVMDAISLTTDYEKLAGVDFVIENVTEKWDIKAPIYRSIDAICKPECVFAANTSAIPITRIASATKRPDKVLGIHFMNPVPLKPAAEVIRGYHTSDESLEVAKGLLAAMGKEAIVVRDSPGFVSNRVLMLTVNETIYLVQEGVASAEDVDRVFTSCFGHKMGPLATADLIGLDTILLSIEVLYESFSDSKYRPCPLLRKMVDAGLLGKKSGKGFYNY
jgi:3-hydroxybutyryl-CoA dehydrogenase